MRGKDLKELVALTQIRITPAYAGKRPPVECVQCLDEDHPCICGEKFTLNKLKEVLQGSPLHMRGKGKRC